MPMKRERLDPFWHKARVAARVLLKARQGKPLSARDKRVAAILGGEKGVTNRLIQQGIHYWIAPNMLDQEGQCVPRVCNVVVRAD